MARLSDSSDEELTVEILRRWHGLRQAVPQETGWLRKLSELSGTPFRTLDWVRRTRNRLAHPESESRHLVTRQDLIRAVGILDRAERNITATPRPRPKKSTDGRKDGQPLRQSRPRVPASPEPPNGRGPPKARRDRAAGRPG